MKRFISLLLTFALALPLAACGLPNASPNGSNSARTLAQADYPKMTAYPDAAQWGSKKADDWSKDLRERRSIEVKGLDRLDGFLAGTSAQFLGNNSGENRIFSPLNVYMALAMLTELTDGETRSQILSLLGTDSVEELREQASALWNKNYRNDGASTCILASSLWLNQDVRFVQKTLDSLAEHYFASAYQGEMGSPELDEALRDWLNEQTGGLLKEQAAGLHLDPLTVLALATTIYFKARWSNEFNKNATSPDVFHSTNGEEQTDFMHLTHGGNYFWGERFSAVGQGLQSDGVMWFLLPDEGVTPEALLEDSEAMAFLLGSKYDWENQKHLLINLAVPKFDVSSDISLIEGLQALGVTDVFDTQRSDFSPMTQGTEEICVSQAQHAARVKIDEEGVEAAAYTVMAATGAAMPPKEEVDFILDRPFLFTVTGGDGLPLFIGIVNQCG